MGLRKVDVALLCAAVLLAATFASVKPAFSVETKLYFSPAIVYQKPNEFFTVDLSVTSVEFLYNWQVNLTFNPDVLRIVKITEGDFLMRQPNGTVSAQLIETSWALFGWTTKGEFVGESGSGVLAQVQFEVLSIGESLLEFDRNPDRTYLDAQTSPNPPPNFEPIEFTPEDGVFINTITPPFADFQYSPLVPGINEQITFDASASNATPPLEISEYFWNFGDGTNVTVQTPTNNHTYTSGGIYTISLTVFDNASASDLIESIYNTTEMPSAWYELYSTKTLELGIALPHDIAITKVATSNQEATAGDTVRITVTVTNLGTETEDFSVSAYYGSNLIDTQDGTDLTSGEQNDLVFEWNTDGVAPGTYRIKAVASAVEGETHLQNNEFIDGSVKINAGSVFPVTLIIGGAVAAALIVILVVVVLLRRRKTSP